MSFAAQSEIENHNLLSYAEIQAERHAKWISYFAEWIYKQAYVHGFKHGVEHSENLRGKG